MIHSCTLNVLIKGRVIKQYFHNNQSFIEGRGGSSYELEFVNHNPWRVEVVLAVDGLSVTDGKTAGPASTGYIVGAGQRLRVPGWTLDHTAVAAFAFAGAPGRSYVEQSTGSTANKGVIGALVYQEQPIRAMPVYRGWTAPAGGAGPHTPGLWTNSVGGSATSNHIGGSATSNHIGGSATSNHIGGSATSNHVGDSAASFNASMRPAARGVEIGTSGGIASDSASDWMPVEQSLGTGFGAASDFHTQTISFARGVMVAMLTLYYDDRRGLKARGVPLDRAYHVASQPQAFPGLTTGCTPPPGWTGDDR